MRDISIHHIHILLHFRSVLISHTHTQYLFIRTEKQFLMRKIKTALLFHQDKRVIHSPKSKEQYNNMLSPFLKYNLIM